MFLDDVDGYIEENDGIKYLVFTLTENKPIKCRKDFLKPGFESDDDLPLGKIFNIIYMIIVAASVIEKDGKFYPQISLHECAYKL